LETIARREQVTVHWATFDDEECASRSAGTIRIAEESLANKVLDGSSMFPVMLPGIVKADTWFRPSSELRRCEVCSAPGSEWPSPHRESGRFLIRLDCQCLVVDNPHPRGARPLVTVLIDAGLAIRSDTSGFSRRLRVVPTVESKQYREMRKHGPCDCGLLFRGEWERGCGAPKRCGC
jgi:hypothetical protein